MIRLIPKHKHEDWMIRLGKIGDTKKVVALLLKGENPDASPELDELLKLPMTYSDYHGVGQLETPYFIILMDTFPPLVKKCVIHYDYDGPPGAYQKAGRITLQLPDKEVH
ncbi:hypothetical protein ES703_15828 [subsurface metagenome]